jgi:CTP:molybdopterin cytidylyltransferase MocA
MPCEQAQNAHGGDDYDWLNNIETQRADPKASTLAAIAKALGEAGAVFTNGDEPGVKLRKAKRD